MKQKLTSASNGGKGMSAVRTPKVTVVIPAFNHEKYIAEAILSVARQGLPELELHVLDDGSEDATVDVAEQTLAGQAGLKWSLDTQVNAGSATTLNRLIDHVDADYVAILNSDDFYSPDRLKRLLRSAEGEDLFFGFTGVQFYQSNESRDYYLFEDWYREKFASATGLPSCGFALICANITITSSNFLFSRELFDLTGGFEPNLTLTQDWQFAVMALRWVEPTLLPERLLNYRVHPTNTYRRLYDHRVDQSKSVVDAYASWAEQPCLNTRAPTPGNWPQFFPFFMRICSVAFENAPIGTHLPAAFLGKPVPNAGRNVDEAQEEEAIVKMISVAQDQTELTGLALPDLLRDVARIWNSRRGQAG